MKMTDLTLPLAAALLCAMLAASPAALAQARKAKPTPEEVRAQLGKDVSDTIAAYRKADPGIERFLKESAGYAVFPRIGKAGFIFGGGHGAGEVFQGGKPIGTVSITLATVGIQVGVQEFSEIIFFRDGAALDRFKQNKFELTANISAVIVKSGASDGANYRDGVVVFTQPRGGAMVEAALGTQKFKFSPESAATK